MKHAEYDLYTMDSFNTAQFFIIFQPMQQNKNN